VTGAGVGTAAGGWADTAGAQAAPAAVKAVNTAMDLNEIDKIIRASPWIGHAALAPEHDPYETNSTLVGESVWPVVNREGEAGGTYEQEPSASRPGVAGTLHAHRQRRGREEAPALIMSDAFA
jgi:hypothetical protein